MIYHPSSSFQTLCLQSCRSSCDGKGPTWHSGSVRLGNLWKPMETSRPHWPSDASTTHSRGCSAPTQRMGRICPLTPGSLWQWEQPIWEMRDLAAIYSNYDGNCGISWDRFADITCGFVLKMGDSSHDSRRIEWWGKWWSSIQFSDPPVKPWIGSLSLTCLWRDDYVYNKHCKVPTQACARTAIALGDPDANLVAAGKKDGLLILHGNNGDIGITVTNWPTAAVLGVWQLHI